MMWTCPECGASVNEGADRCWACKQPRPKPEPGSQTASTRVPEPDRELAPAVEIINAGSDPTESWTCSKCGETVDAGFLVCWSCGTSIEGVEDPSFVRANAPAVGDDESEAVTFLNDELDELIPGPGPTLPSCLRCQGPLEPGFIADFQQGRGVMKPGEWVAGTPQPSFWTGTWTGDRRFPIQALRCTHCGYLEFWASDPADNSA